MSFWHTKAFKDLQRSWYDRLKLYGFSDIEEVVGEEQKLKHYSLYEVNPVQLSTEIYYAALGELVHETEFRSPVDHIIMTCHAEGFRIRDIVRELERYGHKRTRGAVRFRIRSYEMRWGLRFYSRKELNLKS